MFNIHIDQKILSEIKNIKDYAENNIVPENILKEMINYGKPDYKGPLPAGVNPKNTIKIFDLTGTFYYKIALSIEEMNSTWIRHISFSTSLQDFPNEFIYSLLPLFGFKSTNKKDLFVHAIHPVIHILEPINTTWEDILKNPKNP